MTRLLEINWNDQAFQSVVLEKKKKVLVHSLVKQHAATSTDEYDDIIAGKGKGIIGLFSGPPGCGKTLTAEAISELLQRPLYTVSAGELGITPKEVDERLTLILELAHKWHAVLLLDEADVFLERRGVADINRNALVSIFLRQLEYFQGTLLLTTNRLDSCDVAFESRIHITLHFEELSEDARRQVWQTFVTKARENSNGLEVALSPQDIDLLAKRPINGRQIKNIMSGARAVAREQNKPLDMEDIDLVMDAIKAIPEKKGTLGPALLVRDTMTKTSDAATQNGVLSQAVSSNK